MERWRSWKRYMAGMAVLSLLTTGLVLGCGRSGGGNGGQTGGGGTPTPNQPSGTGTVVITGRIL